MKIFLFNNFNISTYEIENLIDFLDQDNNGFIPSQDFIKEVELAWTYLLRLILNSKLFQISL